MGKNVSSKVGKILKSAVNPAGRRRKGVKKPSVEDRREVIARKAYELYEQRGRTPGEDLGDWFKAESIIEVGEIFDQ